MLGFKAVSLSNQACCMIDNYELRIAFVVYNPKPASCGVTDYAIRMLGALQSLGCQVALIDATNKRPAFPIATEDQEIIVHPFNHSILKQFDIAILQHVPDAKRSRRLVSELFIGKASTEVGIMLHEFSRPQAGAPTSLRWRLAHWLEQRELFYLVRACSPRLLLTSNDHYAKCLLEMGISTRVAPMPGTIPILKQLEYEVLTNGSKNESETERKILWVSFGSLYTDFWNISLFFTRLSELRVAGEKHSIVICGRQSESIRNNVLTAAQSHDGFIEIKFTGSLEASEIDAWLQQADGSFSGTDIAFWEKSTGVLAAVERSVPVYFPRNFTNVPNEQGDLLFLSVEDMLLELRRPNRARQTYEGPHSLRNASRQLLKLLGSDNT